MTTSETPLEMVQRHVRRGEEHIARLKQIVREMDRGKFPAQAAMADNLLALLRSTQLLHLDHLQRLTEEPAAPRW